jgi:hypothetical protein
MLNFILGDGFKSFSFTLLIGIIIYSIVLVFAWYVLLLCFVAFRIFFTKYKVGVLCEHIIEIDENGFTESTSVNRDFRSWNAIYKIKENKKYIFIFIAKYVCHAIPKNSFDSIGESNYFYGNLFSLWNKNKSL